ncbi:uncharacterized protein N7496_007907 [Penicillium cataractarum]|uniref:Uncharacterized protein n=1 Tax=Penicillium cataractarum TaxID=2100454 RepID=A0A9W9RXL9_9EURO|nr:uncharacterized protein N7496_007907 [Penicillium cataractarum]KAJ5368147.1 hypothetical protein N7496_007907 [Penicillium cataractarum]
MIELPNLDLQLVFQNCAKGQNINSVETLERKDVRDEGGRLIHASNVKMTKILARGLKASNAESKYP